VNVIASTDLLYWSQPDPIGLRHGGNWSNAGLTLNGRDRLRYIVWVDPGRPYRAELGNGWQGHAASRPELAPRQALHLVACRNGGHP
jgi:hypothetical protein